MSTLIHFAYLLLQGKVIDGRWRVGDRLGAGAMGVVFLCADARTNSPDDYVIKFMDSEQDREAIFAAKLKNVKNDYLIPIEDVDSYEPGDPNLPKKLYYIVMPKAECTLADETMWVEMSMFTIGTSGPWIESYFITDICNGLSYLYEKAPGAPVVHRDLKPANILYYRGKWVLADFGILRPGSLTDTVYATAIATKKYAPPEFDDDIDGRVPVKPSWDVYSLGVIVYQLCTGKLWKRKHEDLPEDDPELRNCREYLRRICAGCIRVEPKERLTVAEILGIVQDASAEETREGEWYDTESFDEIEISQSEGPPPIEISLVRHNLYAIRSDTKNPHVKNEAMRQAIDEGRSAYTASSGNLRIYHYDDDSAIFEMWELARPASNIDPYTLNSDDLRRHGAKCLVYGILPIDEIQRNRTLRSLWLPSRPTQHEELGFTL